MTRSTLDAPRPRSGEHRLIFVQELLDQMPHGSALWQRSAPQSPLSSLYGALHQAIATALTDKQRQAVELFFFEGLSQGEIARRLGVSQQVVQKRLFGASRGGRTVGGAIAKLRKALLINLPSNPLLKTP